MTMMEHECSSVLVVEDNEGDFLLVSEFLKEAFPKVVITHKKRLIEAERSLNEQTFDVILLDLTLPDSNGLESIDHIAAVANHTPVIVLTGFSEKDFGIRTLSKGVSDYLLKDELSVSHLYKSIIYSIERKRIGLRLVQSEENYKALFQMSPLPTWVMDLESHQFLHVNEAAITHYGYSEGEFLSMTVHGVQATPTTSNDHWPDSVAFGLYDGLTKHKTKSGRVIQVQLQSNLIEFKSKRARLVIATDITDEIQNRQKIVHYNQRLQTAQEIGQLGYWELNLRTNEVYWSEEAYKILGRDARELLTSEQFYQIVHSEDLAQFKQARADLLNGNLEHDVEYRVMCNDGNIKHIFQRTSVVNDEKQNPLRLEGIIQDVTERWNYIKEIEDQNLKLKDIAWIQSHVVRAPLTRLMGLIRIINDPSDLQLDRAQLLDEVLNSAYELDVIIREIVKKTEQIENQTTNL